MLESEEAARRLGVKTATLYAYVSRGLLPSHPSPNSRRSLFDVDDIERLAARARTGKTVETRLATVTTSITQLREDGPAYRGVPAVDLASSASFEEVAEWLWNADSADGRSRSGNRRLPLPSEGSGQRWEALPLGDHPEMGSMDMMRWAVVMAGAHNPLRADLRPDRVSRTARGVAASMVELLPGPPGRPVALELPDGRDRSGSMAERLAAKLSSAPTAGLVRCVNAALVLMADHELATSTLAVRLAASTHADLCDAVLAGLGTIAGPLHGGASQLAYGLLVDAEHHGVEQALDDTLRWQRVLPGFGHPVYKNGDPRFEVLLTLFNQMATPGQIELVQAIVALAATQGLPAANVDLALAAISWSAGMPRDAGRTIFTVARVAGWTAHYLEELGERPLRFRARAVYASPGRAEKAVEA
ncbi:MAG TPA: citrate/2-methylcitrate synthase [Acidimicrobiales bacterium]|jgi:citrate synthase|nr:citrate/2-methylcitrate synthase [Acidimicrobiales bacterium]